MPPTKTPRHVEVREAASGTVNGETFVLNRGEILAADHPIAQAYPDFFKPLDRSRSRPMVEQATAAPGEQRGQ